MVLVLLNVICCSADSCSVRDTERKAAIMQFSSDHLPQQNSSFLNQDGDQRYTEHKMLNLTWVSDQILVSEAKAKIKQCRVLFGKSAVCKTCIFTVLLIISRSCHQRLALVDRLTKKLSLLTDTDDIVLNFDTVNPRDQKEMVTDSVHKDTEGKMSKSKSSFVFSF